MSHFLDIKDLNVQYTSGGEVIHAVNGVSFHLDKGKTLALVGETGAGKTTICKTILRILPDRAAKVKGGTVELDGQELLSLPEAQMRKIRGQKISMVFQDPMTALNPVMKVGNQIAEAIRLHNDITKREAEERAKDMMTMVGITPERYNEYPHQFSGGMKQRVVIAMALACTPDLLLADEPTTALDVTIQAQILEMIADLRKQYNTSMILVTHDLGVVANVADRIAVMYAGDIVELGTCDEVFYDPRHPYTWALLSSLPQLGTKDEPLYSIQGTPPNLFHEVKGDAFAPRNPKALKIDFVERPPFFEVTPTHYARTWLMDPRAPKVEPPEHVRILREKGVNRVG